MRALACYFVLAGAVLSAQTPAPSPSQPPPQFRAAANHISLIVTPHDAAGEFAGGLGVQDFHVFEDGIEQSIVHFGYSRGGRVYASTSPAAVRSSEGRILPAAAPPPPDVASRLFIVFIDDLHITPDLTPRLKSVLRQVRDMLHDSDLVGFVSTGYSSVERAPAYDVGHRRFDGVVNKVMGAGLTMSQMLTMQQGGDGLAELNHHAHVAFATAHDLLSQMEQMTDVRKAFIWISGGYSLNPLKESRLKIAQQNYHGEDPFATPGMQFKEADLVGQVAELTRAANRANVTFFPIDPRGLMTGPGVEQREQISYSDVRDYQEQTTSTLRVLASETGGLAAVNTNDLSGYLKAVDRSMSDYYTIGYQSTNADSTAFVRKIEIRVAKPGVVLTPGVDYRDSYSLRRR